MQLRPLLAVCAVIWGVIAPARVAHAEEFIVDNSAPHVQISGAWTSTALTGGFVGSDYLFRPSSTGDATVFWPVPPNLAPGRYEVSARWTSGPNRASNAVYWIRSESGVESVTRNQQAGGGDWQSLGTFAFQSGRGQGITLAGRSDGVVIADAMRWLGPLDSPSASTAPAPAPAPAAAPAPDASAVWTVTTAPTAALHAGPDASTERLASLPQFSYLQVLDYSGEWAYVYNPRARGTAYIPSTVLGPSSPPPAWVTAAPPSPVASIERMGRSVGSTPVAFYPVDDTFAVTSRLGHNVPILIHDQVRGADGSTWYRIDQGYLAAGSVRLPRPPERMLTGQWIDADLTEPAMLTAYESDRPVRTMLAIKGTQAHQTPTGTFSIGRRVEDETMNSDTIGIPRDGPGGYFLEHVLFTQYFSSDGASIHFNYWSSNFGYSGSHGCLGVNREDAEYVWNWATLGTRVVIHN